MTGRDAKQRHRRTRGPAPTLFPGPEGADADAHGSGELRLREPHEAAHGGHIVTRLEATGHETPALAGGNRPRKNAHG